MSSTTTSTTMSSNTTFEYYENYLKPLMPYNCIIGVPALLLNVLVFLHYTKTCKNLVPSMYLLITSCDSLMILFLISQHMLLELFHNAPTEANSVIIILSTALMGASYRCSVFANILLAVARTSQVRDPFYQIRKSLVHRAFAICLGVWLALATYDVVYMLAIDNFESGVVLWADVYSTDPLTGYGVAFTLIYWLGHSDLLQFLLGAVLAALPLMVPAVIALVCMFIQLRELNKPPPPGVPDRIEEQKHMTITVLLLTTLFCICNTCFSMCVILYYISVWSGNDFAYSTAFWIINCSTVTTLPLLNAAFSPLILVTRSTALKAAMGTSIRRVLRLQPAVNPPPARGVPAAGQEMREVVTAEEPASTVVANPEAVLDTPM